MEKANKYAWYITKSEIQTHSFTNPLVLLIDMNILIIGSIQIKLL